MKKTFDTSSITNQLKGASAFFPYEGKADAQEQTVTPPQPSPEQVNTASKSPISRPVASLEHPKPNQPPTFPSVSNSQPITEPPAVIPPVRSNVRTNETTFERTNVRSKIRHTFDIYADQLMSLREIALKREATFGKRTLLGDLVQEALDMFLAKERNKE